MMARHDTVGIIVPIRIFIIFVFSFLVIFLCHVSRHRNVINPEKFRHWSSVVNDQIIPRRPSSAHTWDGAAAGTPVAVLFFTHTSWRVVRSEAQTRVMGVSRVDPQIIAHHQRHPWHVTKCKKKTWAPPQVRYTIQPYHQLC